MKSHDPASERHAPESGTVDGVLRPDFLSQVLSLIRLRAEMVFAAELAAPWSLTFAPGSAWFHVVSEGGMRIEASDGRVIEAGAGDLLVLPQGRGHVRGTPGGRSIDVADAMAQRRDHEGRVRIDGDGPTTRMITGAFRFEGDNLRDMLAVLPSIMHVPRNLRGEDDSWIDTSTAFVLAEAKAGRPGASILISRMVDVFVLRLMRIWVQTAKPEDKGWLGALADPRISRALKTIHDAPFERRTVADLADIAGMSRSSFAERFARLIGAAPLHYQTRWRLLLAHEMLNRTDARVSDVARQVGYDSDAAFSRAYKAQFGVPPVLSKRATG
jgi:AraC-like DNA-binding protein